MRGLTSLFKRSYKQINDRVGHAIGDTVLKAVADKLTMLIRVGDT